MSLELTVSDYDRIGSSDPMGRVVLGYHAKGAALKHWKEMVENPRRPVIHWHVLQVHSHDDRTNRPLSLLPLHALLRISRHSLIPKFDRGIFERCIPSVTNTYPASLINYTSSCLLIL